MSDELEQEGLAPDAPDALKASAGSGAQIEQLSFREGSEELEQIVRKLEGNQLELEESLVLYERGVHLLRQLQAQLDNAQQKVTVLIGELEVDSDDEPTN